MLHKLVIIIISMSVLLFTTLASAQQSTVTRLSDFYAGDSTLRLQGKAAVTSLSIPLAPGRTVESASIKLSAVSSLALIRDRSILNVRFNNATIGQIKYDPDRPNVTSSVVIPAALWRSGYNSLTFAVSQHYGDQCVDGSAPELWSEIDLYRSALTMTTLPSRETPTLNQLSHYFNNGIGGQERVLIASATDTDANITQLALPKVAQALALRREYQPLSVDYRQLTKYAALPELPDVLEWDEEYIEEYDRSAWYLTRNENAYGVHVIVDTLDNLEKVTDVDRFEEKQGPLLIIERTPSFFIEDELIVPSSIRLLVTGHTPQDVVTAAETLALMDDALNPDSIIEIVKAPVLNAESTLKAHLLHPGSAYSFAEMNTSDVVFRGANRFYHSVEFKLPADFYVPESSSVSLFLDFGYGAAMGPGSMMNVLVNGELVHGLPFDNPNGDSFQNYQLMVPARFFVGGSNTIDFEVALQAPLSDVDCDEVPSDYLLFQLFADSSLELPEAGSVAVQPDLALLADMAYPFAQFNTVGPAAFYVSDSAMTGSALSLIGKLAQSVGTYIQNVSLQAWDGQTVTGTGWILTTPNDITSDYAQQYETSLANTKKWAYRLQNELHNRLLHALGEKEHQPSVIQEQTEQLSTLGQSAVLIANENSVNQQKGTVFMLATETSGLMQKRVDDLISNSMWGQLAGDFYAWDSHEKPLLVMQVADKVELGTPLSFWDEARMYLSSNPLYWAGLVAALAILIALLAYLMLRRRNSDIEQQWK